MRKSTIAVSLSCLIFSWIPGAARAGIFNVVIENDAFFGTDYYYTNGLLFDYVSDRHDASGRIGSFIYRLPNIDASDKVYTGIHLGQQIFTPTDTRATQLLEGDRPYAGFLFGGLSLIATNHRSSQQWRFSFGAVGPRSKAESFQTSIHDRIGVSMPQGWEHQIKDENIFQFDYIYSWRQAWRFSGDGMGKDIVPTLGVALGNAAVRADLGVTFRYGHGFGADFGPPRIQPAISGADYRHPGQVSWYLFAGFGGRYVARDIFLDGNTHLESHSVDKKPWVGDVQLGFVINGSSYRLAYTLVARSIEYEGQKDPHAFGSLALSFRF